MQVPSPVSSEGHQTLDGDFDTASIPRNIQSAFNGLLYPEVDSFPFVTIWSSGSSFKQEVLRLIPEAVDKDAS